jgi:hypothetical protein
MQKLALNVNANTANVRAKQFPSLVTKTPVQAAVLVAIHADSAILVNLVT